ncbi:GNAT family N-acetyltransferase [Thermodesulfobacteriota bacterium]
MMQQEKPTYTTAWIENFSQVDKDAWDALAVPLKTPFLEWEWLRLMETSGSITAETGWQPNHLTVWSGQRLVAAAPLYIKTHSEGEFVFDYAWADLANRLGISFYPKLVGMTPVTPVTGYRFLIASKADERYLTELMVREIDRFCIHNRISGCSFLFVDPEWCREVAPHGFRHWVQPGYAWKNQNFTTFEDYLVRFNSNQRRNIKRERKAIDNLGIRMRTYTGDEIHPDFFPLMYRFYVKTNTQFGPWSCKYLTPAFFDELYHKYRHRILLTVASQKHNERLPVGMSLLINKGDRLFGRYWGGFDSIRFLHFNACYYSPIEWAIVHRVSRFDPGIGGYHKIRRGFEAVPNFSLRKFYDPHLRQILQLQIDEINRLEQEQIDALNTQLPFAENT